MTKLENEAIKATEILKGKVVSKILRHRPNELIIEFTDGSRLFVDKSESELEISIT